MDVSPCVVWKNSYPNRLNPVSRCGIVHASIQCGRRFAPSQLLNACQGGGQVMLSRCSGGHVFPSQWDCGGRLYWNCLWTTRCNGARGSKAFRSLICLKQFTFWCDVSGSWGEPVFSGRTMPIAAQKSVIRRSIVRELQAHLTRTLRNTHDVASRG